LKNAAYYLLEMFITAGLVESMWTSAKRMLWINSLVKDGNMLDSSRLVAPPFLSRRCMPSHVM